MQRLLLVDFLQEGFYESVREFFSVVCPPSGESSEAEIGKRGDTEEEESSERKEYEEEEEDEVRSENDSPLSGMEREKIRLLLHEKRSREPERSIAYRSKDTLFFAWAFLVLVYEAVVWIHRALFAMR